MTRALPTAQSRLILSLAFIIILGLLSYSRSFNGDFVWDDYFLVKHNKHITSGSFIPNIFSEDVGAGSGKKIGFYRPLQMLSYMFNYHFWKTDVRAYHITNTVLHILVGLAVFWLVRTLFQDQFLALLTGLLFVAHPLHSEAVMYISGRSDSLAALFILLTLIFYIKYLAFPSPGLYGLTLLSCLFALLSRELALIIPLLLLLYHYVFGPKVKRKIFLPILAATFLYIWLRLTLLKSYLPEIPVTSVYKRIPGFLVALVNYFRLILAPFDLHMEYGKKAFVFSEPRAVAGAIILLLLIAALYRLRKRERLLFFSLAWFLLTLLPSSNIFPLNAYMSEHWLYLPSLGLCLIAARYLTSFFKRLPSLAVLFLALTLSFYSFLTLNQADYWRNPLVFYKRTIRYSPESARLYANLASTYRERGEFQQAITWYKKALAVDPEFAEVYSNMGNVCFALGRRQEAKDLYLRSIQLKPRFYGAYFNLADYYAKEKNEAQAIQAYRKGLEINPDHAGAQNSLAALYLSSKQYPLAVKHFNLAIKLGYEVSPQAREFLKAYRE